MLAPKKLRIRQTTKNVLPRYEMMAIDCFEKKTNAQEDSPSLSLLLFLSQCLELTFFELIFMSSTHREFRVKTMRCETVIAQLKFRLCKKCVEIAAKSYEVNLQKM